MNEFEVAEVERTYMVLRNCLLSMIIINSFLYGLKSSCVDEDTIEIAIKSEHLNKQDVSVFGV